MMAMDNPKAFGELMDKVTRTDCARTELAASTPGVDMVVERGLVFVHGFLVAKTV